METNNTDEDTYYSKTVRSIVHYAQEFKIAMFKLNLKTNVKDYIQKECNNIHYQNLDLKQNLLLKKLTQCNK